MNEKEGSQLFVPVNIKKGFSMFLKFVLLDVIEKQLRKISKLKFENQRSELIKVGGSKSMSPLTSAQLFPFIKCWIKVATLTNIGKFLSAI